MFQMKAIQNKNKIKNELSFLTRCQLHLLENITGKLPN